MHRLLVLPENLLVQNLLSPSFSQKDLMALWVVVLVALSGNSFQNTLASFC